MIATAFITATGIGDSAPPKTVIILSAAQAEVFQVDVVVVEIKRWTNDQKQNTSSFNPLLDRTQKFVEDYRNFQHIWHYALVSMGDVLNRRLQQIKSAPLLLIRNVFYQNFKTKHPNGQITPTQTSILSFDTIIENVECRNHTLLEIQNLRMKATGKVNVTQNKGTNSGRQPGIF